jgi:hypothetical protein
MKYLSSLFAASAVLVLGLLAPAQAAPASGTAGNLKAVAGDSAAIEQVRHRCYRHRGHWHCPSHGYYPYDYYGPGFYFESGRHHHHHRHWR